MRAYDVILKKRNGQPLEPDEIAFMVEGYVHDRIPESQMAALLMAIYFRGMTPAEMTSLTMAMVGTGQTLDLRSIPGRKVDKHSTGGVGDKTTLVLVPVLAEAGLPIAKMSGRSLGHTGGTLDKLESIPGLRTDLTPDEIVSQVRQVGAAICAQTADLMPADKKIYALRDLIAAVDSVPLIASSVMSKKIASGADAIVLDVKVGAGAFMKTVHEARELALAMVRIGQEAGRQTCAVISDMEQPLGNTVGNALEVREAIETLKGHGPADLTRLCVVLGGLALVLGGVVSARAAGESMIHDLITSGSGAERFRRMIHAQGGNAKIVDEPALLPSAPVVLDLKSPKSGYISRLDAYTVARAEVLLGGCRGESSLKPDPSVGVVLKRKVGDFASEGDTLAEIHAGNRESGGAAKEVLLTAYNFTDNQPSQSALIHDIID